ncbi:MAG: hypothetical protein LBE11_00115 [Prevotellaceae bacterium]|jgi:hypothetical protein|nr:hypothetical protein [Prevotellaceae bacterium]
MERINEFEKILTDRVSQIENQDVTIDQFNKFLMSDGQIRYRYISILLGCEISAYYKGIRYYGIATDSVSKHLKLTIDYNF